MSYTFEPSLKAALKVSRVPDPPRALAGNGFSGLGVDGRGVGRAVRAVVLGLLAAELDRAVVRKGHGKRLDDRYGAIAALVAIIGLEI
jgi:hypothetical protein